MTEAEFNAEHYPRLLADKANRIRSIFSRFGNTELEVFSSPPHHHRMRAEFRVWHDDDDLYYIMFDPETKEPFRVDQLPLASRAINDLMPRLLTLIKPNDTLRRRLFQIDFLSSLSGEMVVSMLYHRPLDEGWVTEARKLRRALQTEDMELHVIGRARKMKYLVERDYVVERLHVNGSPIIYQQVENSFTQPNAVVAQKMLSWAVDCTRSLDGDLLELYCGNGNFSLALAQNFDRVLATEVSKSSIKSAQYNIDVNAIENVKVARLSADEVVEALDGVREFRRLRNADVEIKDYRFSTVFVDPPRAGLSKDGCATASRFDHIVYISCNPATLESNLVELTKTHRVTRFAFFDQFPYTEHAEVGVRLDRR